MDVRHLRKSVQIHTGQDLEPQVQRLNVQIPVTARPAAGLWRGRWGEPAAHSVDSVHAWLARADWWM